MTFYRVLPQYDSIAAEKLGTRCGWFPIKDSIWTEKEVARYNVPMKILKKCEVKKNKTYWFFGARFESTL